MSWVLVALSWQPLPTARSVSDIALLPAAAATDDGWVIGRFPNGSIIPDPKVFPHGVKATADYLHSIEMKLGLYTSRGQTTCLRRVGSQDYEKVDMQQYADWGVDCAARAVSSRPLALSLRWCFVAPCCSPDHLRDW
eukprot:COSAG01_NODE_467_length_16597_cov_10.933446_2_plen_137_part_00